MKLVRQEDGNLTVDLTRAEVGLIVACMNEAINGLDIDFPIRTGYARDKARMLMRELVPFVDNTSRSTRAGAGSEPIV